MTVFRLCRILRCTPTRGIVLVEYGDKDARAWHPCWLVRQHGPVNGGYVVDALVFRDGFRELIRMVATSEQGGLVSGDTTQFYMPAHVRRLDPFMAPEYRSTNDACVLV